MELKKEMETQVDEIMKFYMLQVRYHENMGKIDKIYTDQGVFALKSIDPKIGMDFIRNVQKLYQRGYNRIVPIFMTMDNRYGVLNNGKLYYLMPWLLDDNNSERNEKHKHMFRELARMHTLTSKEIEVKKEEREAHYEKTVELWNKQKEFLEEFVQASERKWYMSPFELLYCSYYHDISQALTFSIKKLEEWYEKTKDSEKLRTVVTHGKVSISHFLYDDRGYGHFINFEDSKTAPVHFDLLPFIVNSCKTYPIRHDDAIDWLYTYLKYFSLKEEEMMLFLSYLAHPGAIISSVEHYHEKRNQRTEIMYMKNLQRNYWTLKNVEYVVMRIDEIEKQKKAAAAAAAQQD
ncbi:spore coat protein YsxE [Peribacillus acanthi]|uniref:spore coat protein YsxE n=1 Tax=Peribacillus acanthi TaxID=2171554 RepID=UPI000D3EB8E5|nr:spore coat protein YsxE [Peribacillus acanthi]